MKTLHLGSDLHLPLRTVTEKIAWLGRTGSGKTYGAQKLAELMLEAGAQIGAIDPVGVWPALRIPKAKGGQSFEVVVFGGLRGDLPLEPTAGVLIADLVCDRGLSFVLDVSQFIPAEQQRFVHAFADRFFHRKKSAPSAVHLFMEECQEFIPENPSKEEAKTLGVMQRLWKLGRNFGIGGSLISQRPQEIAKKALNMSGTLFAFQMTGPQERKAVKAWVADKGVAIDIEAILQKLEVGQPHVESPMFLEISRKVRILPKVTADLSSTPEVGVATGAKRPLTPIDVEKIKTSMAATIERAKADDPRELRKTIADLRAQLARAGTEKPTPAPAAKPPRVVERLILKDAQVKRLEASIERFARTCEAHEKTTRAALDKLLASLVDVRHVGLEVKAAIAAATATRPTGPGGQVGSARLAPVVVGAGRQEQLQARPAPVVRPPRPTGPPPEGALPAAQQRIVDALAWLAGVGIPKPDKTQVALFADLTPGAGHTISSFGALRSGGLISYPTPGTVSLTDAGEARADTSSVPQSAKEMQDQVLAKLPSAQRRILSVLIAAYPTVLTKDDATKNAGLVPGAGHTISSYGRLRSLGLIDYPTPGQVVALPVLFLEKE